MPDKTARYIETLTARLHAQERATADANTRVARLERDNRDMVARNIGLADEIRRRAAERDEVAAALHDSQVAAAERSTADALLRVGLDRVLGPESAVLALEMGIPVFIEALLVEHRCERETAAARHLDEIVKITKAFNAERGDLATLLQTVEARETAVQAKEAELRALLDKAEAKLRERERREASAILNRQLLAGATPGRNHR